jgi:hypothetical protein
MAAEVRVRPGYVLTASGERASSPYPIPNVTMRNIDKTIEQAQVLQINEAMQAKLHEAIEAYIVNRVVVSPPPEASSESAEAENLHPPSPEEIEKI